MWAAFNKRRKINQNLDLQVFFPLFFGSLFIMEASFLQKFKVTQTE